MTIMRMANGSEQSGANKIEGKTRDNKVKRMNGNVIKRSVAYCLARQATKHASNK